MIRLGILILIGLCSLAGFGQNKSTTTVEQVWLGYFNQTRLSNKWGIWFDGQLRTKDDFFKDLSVSILLLDAATASSLSFVMDLVS